LRNLSGFLSVCYHYIREDKQDVFPRILGTTKKDFEEHLRMMKRDFSIINLAEVKDFFLNKKDQGFKDPGMLITFDDGLSDHYHAAKILSDNDIQGVFFIPTCIFEEKLPANPMIIHYTIAEFGVKKFIDEFISILEKRGLQINEYEKIFSGKKDVWNKIDDIKEIFKYKLEMRLSREILIEIYNNIFLEKYPDAMSKIHLTENQVKDMLEMGHAVGTHTHTHVSVKSSNLSKDDFFEEIIKPKTILEQKFQINVDSLSYPFGSIRDCLMTKQLIDKTNLYKIAFTVEEIFNSKNTNLLEIGRYQPSSNENSLMLKEKLECIITKNRL